MTDRRPAPQHEAPDPPDRSAWQKIRNESWPLRDKHGHGHARGIPTQAPVPVMVWLDFERDGICWLRARAIRWHGDSVCVAVADERLAVPYVWVSTADVQRL